MIKKFNFYSVGNDSLNHENKSDFILDASLWNQYEGKIEEYGKAVESLDPEQLDDYSNHPSKKYREPKLKELKKVYQWEVLKKRWIPVSMYLYISLYLE